MPDFPSGSSAAPTLYQTICIDRRYATVRHDHHLHTIVERKALGPEALRRCGRSKQSQRNARESDSGVTSLRPMVIGQ